MFTETGAKRIQFGEKKVLKVLSNFISCYFFKTRRARNKNGKVHEIEKGQNFKFGIYFVIFKKKNTKVESFGKRRSDNGAKKTRFLKLVS